MQAYSNPNRANDPYALPDIEVFQLTAEEAVQQNEDLMWEASKQFPLMHMNSRDRQKAIDWAIKESGCTGGWYWQSCFPGCMPYGSAIGPFDTREDALADAQQDADDVEDDVTVCKYCGKEIIVGEDGGWRHLQSGVMPICNHIPEPSTDDIEYDS